MRDLLLITIALLALLPIETRAGWIIKGFHQDEGGPAQPQTTFLHPAGLRVETSDRLIIYQARAQKFIMADPAAKTYQILDKASLQQLSRGMNAAFQQMEQTMTSLTPEQRAMMEQVMGGQTGTLTPHSPSTPPVYQKLADSVRVGPWSTAHYAVLQNGTKESEIWIASPSDLPVDRELIKLFTEMSRFFSDLSSTIPGSARQEHWTLELAGDGAPAGIPVKETIFQNGRPVTTWALTEAARADIDPSQFDTPPGFRPVEFSPGTPP